MNTYTLKIINIKKETEDTISISFKQPALRKIKYRAGQYLTLIFRINGRRYIRPYSFSSAPSVDSSLEITVKRINHGIVSNHIHDQVKIGDSIEVMEAIGDFTLTSDVVNQVCFWGAGSGITPLYSMIKEILNLNKSTLVYLVYGNRNQESIIFKEDLEKLVSDYPSNFKIWHCCSQVFLNQSTSTVIEGRISNEIASQLIIEHSLQNAVHYICGPAGLKESVKNALSTKDVELSKIYSEDFELVQDPKDFEHILTRNIKLKYQDQIYDLEVIKGQSILETGLNSGIELPYSCQTGNCSTCKGKLKTGELKIIGLKNNRSDLESEEYLLCCSYPLTENIYIEV